MLYAANACPSRSAVIQLPLWWVYGKTSDRIRAGAWLADHLGIAPSDVITAGDSGNDLDMMRSDLSLRGIAVGNATDELRRVREPQIYHATTNHAGGIREGLVHYGWLTP